MRHLQQSDHFPLRTLRIQSKQRAGYFARLELSSLDLGRAALKSQDLDVLRPALIVLELTF
jgi:hypothetical protein